MSVDLEVSALIGANGAAKDWIDLRDIYYEPSLSTLGALLMPNPSIVPEERAQDGRRMPSFGVRDQGKTGRCVGHALSNVIDIQRRLQASGARIADSEVASEAMLYFMARFHDQFTSVSATRELEGRDKHAVGLEPEVEGVRSLRSVIKAFYHHGVLIEREGDTRLRWGARRTIPTIAQAKNARETGLGAYYRLRPILNHYHAALKDTGCVIVSAWTHGGWRPDLVTRTGGRIDWHGEAGQGGLHAFAIIGYTSEGFLVLNSWGPDWGGYEGLAGVALWSYQDWARNVEDGWVLRLGVSAPNAFDVSIGEQGLKNAFSRIQAGSTPCLELMGHYIHVDDGQYVEYSAYPTTEEMIHETLRALPQAMRQGARESTVVGRAATVEGDISPSRGLLIWITGAFDGIDVAFKQAVRRKRLAYELGCYPVFVFWCNDFAEQAIGFLRQAFETTETLSGTQARHRDQLIENEVRGPGRAFWREVKSCARKAVWGQTSPDDDAPLRTAGRGPLGDFLNRVYEMLGQTGCEVHLVVEGSGVLVLDETIRLFENLPGYSEDRLARQITSLNLALPALRMGLEEESLAKTLEFMNFINRISGGKAPLPAQVHVPSAALEAQVRNGAYGRTILHLIANAFEDRPKRLRITDEGGPTAAVTMLGMHEASRMWREGGLEFDPFVTLSGLRDQNEPQGATIEQHQLNGAPLLEQRIFEAIKFQSARRRGGAAIQKGA